MSFDLAGLSRLISRTSSALSEGGDRRVSDLGLSRARWQVLGAMAILGAPATVSQIARALGLSRQAVQRTADDLQEAGLTHYQRNPAHLRSDLVVFTEAGRAAYAEATRRQTVWAADLAQGLSADDIQTTRRVLAALAARAAD
jgi:DNA-binding MarR family transcriptional regulator